MAEPFNTSSQAKRFLSFSGGGWNTHSSLAGLVAGGLDGLSGVGRKGDLTTLLADVEGISANSGGSWFLSQLAYSTPFVAGLEQKNSRDQYNSTGYNGQVTALFKGQPKQDKTVLDTIISALPGRVASRARQISQAVGYYANLLGAVNDSQLDWRNIVDRFVYQPYGMLADLASRGLDSARQSWAAGKDLVITAAAQTTPAVLENLGGITQNKIFSATPSANPSLPPQGLVTPLAFNSRVSGSSGKPTVTALFNAGDVNVNLSTNKWFASPSSIRGAASAVLASNVSIVDATTASSSAMALLGAPQTYGNTSLTEGLRNTVASGLRNMSPLASLQNGTLEMPRALPAVPDSASAEARMNVYAQQGIIRLADGGYADNTAAAYMLREIQDVYGTADPFSLTLFMNSSIDPLTGIKMPVGPGATELSSYWVPGDIAKLFGNVTGTGGKDGSSVPFDGIPLLNPLVPSAKVFDITAWYGEKPDWTYAKDSIEMAYYDLNVKTVDNSAFGVKGGQSGRVQIFTTNNKDSFAAPIKPSILDEYAENFTVVRDAIVTQGGFRYLQDALGLA